MKKFIKIAKRILDFLRNNNTDDLDNNGKIEILREEIDGLFSQFKKMSETLDEANGELQVIIKDEVHNQQKLEKQLEELIKEYGRKVENSKAVAEKAQSQIEVHEKLNEKVKEFIV